MVDIWYTVYKLRHAHFNKKLCRQAADAIENLAHDRDYHMELQKDARVEANAILEELQATQAKLAKAEEYIKEHF